MDISIPLKRAAVFLALAALAAAACTTKFETRDKDARDMPSESSEEGQADPAADDTAPDAADDGLPDGDDAADAEVPVDGIDAPDTAPPGTTRIFLSAGGAQSQGASHKATWSVTAGSAGPASGGGYTLKRFTVGPAGN